MKTCPACQKAISARAVRCPYCHTNFDGMAMEQGRRERGRQRTQAIVIGFLFVIAAIYGTAHWLNEPGNLEWLAEREASASPPS